MIPLISTLSAFGEWLSQYLWRLSLELAVLAIVVWVALRLLRVRSPAVRHLFWCLVLAKPVATMLVASPVSLYWFLTPPKVQVIAPTVAEQAAGHGPVFARRSAGAYGNYNRPSGEAPEPAVSAPPIWNLFDRWSTLALVWLTIAGAFALRLLLGWAYVSFLRSSAAIKRDGPLVAMVPQVAGRMGVIRRVDIATSEVRHGPVLAGIWRPVILLPDALARNLSDTQLRFIIAHELCHVRRWDNLVLLIQRLAEMVLFFHPAVWLCGRAMRREAEAACDDAVIAAYGASASYADSLMRVAEFNGGLTRRLLVNTFAATESHLGRRVRRILDGRTGRMTAGVALASLAALGLIGCLGLPTAAQRKSAPAKPTSPSEDTKTMTTASADQGNYGFRYDPMMYVEKGTSVQAAKVRTFVLGKPAAGDKEVLQAELDKIIAKQGPDGSFGNTSRATAEQLTAALDLGLPADSDAARRAADAVVRQFQEGKYEKDWYHNHEAGNMGFAETQALCLANRGDLPEVRLSLIFLAQHPEVYLGANVGCPWTPELFLKAMWAGRNVVDTTAAVDAGLEWIEKNIEPSGCLAYRDPCGLLDCAGSIDRPAARRIVQKQIPLILRGQDPNGGWDGWNLHVWGNHSFVVMRALVRHGLLEDLRKKPPLPADWRIVRSIPAPEGKVWGLAWDGRQLWTCDRQANRAMAISPEDGRVAKTVPLPDGTGRGLGVWDAGLAYTTGKPWTKDPLLLLKLDADSGKVLQTISFDDPKTWPLEMMHMSGVAQVGPRVWVVDSYSGAIVSVDPAKPDDRQVLRMAGPLSIAIAPAGDAVWTVDGWSPYIIKSDLAGRYLACGERPFAGSVDGLAWDGKQLWALDADNHRICVIERTETAPAEAAAGKAPREQGEPLMAKKPQPTSSLADTVKRDGDKVWIEALDMKGPGQLGEDWTTQLRGLQALLVYRGEKAGLDELLAVSGEAFHLCHGDHWEIRTGLVMPTDSLVDAAKAYGYDARWLVADRFYPMQKKGVDAARQQTQRILDELWRQIDAGRPVLVAGVDGRCGNWSVVFGYDHKNGQMYYAAGRGPLQWAGISGLSLDTCGDPKVGRLGFWDSMVRGTTQPGFAGGWLSDVSFVLGEKTGSPSPRYRTMATLQRAVRISRPAQVSTEGTGGVTYHFGEQAYQHWADELQSLDYPAAVLKTRAQNPDVYDLGQMIYQVDQIVRGRSAAAAFCEEATEVLAKGAPGLMAAAKDYREQVAIAQEAFGPFVSGNQKACEAWWSNASLRQAGAAAVRQMLDKDRAAVTAIQNALAAEGVVVETPVAAAQPPRQTQGVQPGAIQAGRVKRDGDKVLIETVNGWTIPDMPSSIHGAQTTVMQAIGQNVTYDELVGASGLAFRMQVSKEGICPSSPHAFCGWQCVSNSNRMLPWKIRVLEVKPDDAPGMAEARKAIVASIDRGIPVQYGSEEDGVIVGYQNGGAEWLCLHPYSKGGKQVFVNSKWPWGIAIFTEPKLTLPTKRQIAEETLRQAVTMAKEKEIGLYFLGFAAWEAWIEKLTALDSADEKTRTGSMQGNSWTYFNLVKGRQAAATYLRSVADQFSPEAAAHLRSAADLYERMATRVLTSKDAPPEVVAPGPWDMKPGQTWRPETLADQVRRLKAALPLEREAIAEIGKALEIEKVDMTKVAHPDSGKAEGLVPQPPTTQVPPKMVKLNGLKQGPQWMTRPGCLISCAQYLKINASPAWIYGGTGYAFALNIAKDVCPSGPTAWPGDSCDARARNVGLAVETFNTDKRQPDFAQGQKRIWDQAQAALEAGHPCMAWEMDVPDWYVVYGCDSEGNYLFDQWGKEARKHYTRLGDSEIGVALVQATSTCPSADDQTVVREAIRFALDNSQGKGSQADWHTGLGGYDTWIAALTDEEALATNKIIGFGMGYNAACWKETRDYAVAFLREAKQRLDTRTLDPLFDEAIGHYATAAANLEGVAKLYPFSKGDDDASQARIMDAARRGKAVEQLKAARQAEVKGLVVLARIGEQLAK